MVSHNKSNLMYYHSRSFVTNYHHLKITSLHVRHEKMYGMSVEIICDWGNLSLPPFSYTQQKYIRTQMGKRPKCYTIYIEDNIFFVKGRNASNVQCSEDNLQLFIGRGPPIFKKDQNL